MAFYNSLHVLYDFVGISDNDKQSDINKQVSCHIFNNNRSSTNRNTEVDNLLADVLLIGFE